MRKDLIDKCEVYLGINGLNIQTTDTISGLEFVVEGITHFHQFFEIQKKFSKAIKDPSLFEPTGVYVPVKCSIHYEDMDSLVTFVLNHHLTDFDMILPLLSSSALKRLKKAIAA